jgi:hypothetical protein
VIRRALLVIGGAAALWGGGCGGPNHTSVNASIAVPFELLSIDTYKVELTLMDPTGGSTLQGPLILTQDTDNEQWVGEVTDVDDQAFEAVVEILAPLPDGSDVLLARASREITVPKGAPFATLTFKPLDFDTNIDDDGDTLTNAIEYANNLNPESADSDGDGIPDAVELGGAP